MPLRTDERLRTENLDTEMVLYCGKRVRNHGVGPICISHNGCKVIVDLRMIRSGSISNVATGIHCRRASYAIQKPPGGVKVVYGLFQGPTTNALGIHAPSVRPSSVRSPPKIHQNIARVSQLA